MLPGTGVEAPEDAELQGLSYGRSFFNYAKGKKHEVSPCFNLLNI